MAEDARTDDEIAAITAVVTDYFQSWFRGEPELMRSVLHPALSKRSPAQPGGPDLTLLEDDATSMAASAGRGPRPQYEHWQVVEVLDVSRDIATVKVRSQPFVEYVHLARFDGRWLIINALYLEAPGLP
jgi:Putative lumazine-binding